MYRQDQGTQVCLLEDLIYINSKRIHTLETHSTKIPQNQPGGRILDLRGKVALEQVISLKDSAILIALKLTTVLKKIISAFQA
jgi:hypothetical protein